MDVLRIECATREQSRSNSSISQQTTNFEKTAPRPKAVSLPIPALAPVMITVLPSILFLLLQGYTQGTIPFIVIINPQINQRHVVCQRVLTASSGIGAMRNSRRKSTCKIALSVNKKSV
jgi:hypothetical protein